MSKQLGMWIGAFIIGMLLIFFSYDLSRFFSTEGAIKECGIILAAFGGTGLVLNLLFIRRR